MQVSAVERGGGHVERAASADEDRGAVRQRERSRDVLLDQEASTRSSSRIRRMAANTVATMAGARSLRWLVEEQEPRARRSRASPIDSIRRSPPLSSPARCVPPLGERGKSS